MQRDVARAVGDRRVQQRDVGLQRRQQPDLAERRVDARVTVVRLHRRSRDRTRVTIAGRPRAAGFESLREREERPVLDLDLAALVRAREHGVGREVRERVARVTGDNFLNELPAEEQRAETRQREHHERELRIAAPPLPHDFAVAADQRVCPTTGCNTSPART